MYRPVASLLQPGAAEVKEKWGQTHTHGERGSASL